MGNTYRNFAVIIVAICIIGIGCSESTGPSPTENSISGAVNIEEISGLSSADIQIYLVRFDSGVATRIDSTNPDFIGEYEFVGFDFGTYGIEAESDPGFFPEYYGFYDADYNGYFNSSDGVSFTYYAHLDNFNVPLYGDFVDTNFYDYEPNDQAINAQDLGIIHAAHISGDISSGGFIPPDDYLGDLDLFKFQSVWTGYLTIDLDWIGSSDLDLFLYDGYGNSVLVESTGSGLPPIHIYRSVYRGDEFIVLVASADYSDDYELSIRIR